MKVDDVYTENIAEILQCQRERELVTELLTAWVEQGLPSNFDDENVRFRFDRNSGFVFLVNDEGQVAMKNGFIIEEYFTCPECGSAGFADDLIDDDANNCCKAFIAPTSQ
ncbi:MAG: hypothetical protein WCJ56_04070 [bacterium]